MLEADVDEMRGAAGRQARRVERSQSGVTQVNRGQRRMALEITYWTQTRETR